MRHQVAGKRQIYLSRPGFLPLKRATFCAHCRECTKAEKQNSDDADHAGVSVFFGEPRTLKALESSASATVIMA
jgi:hypothetical protein